jgi:hypothetical protein
LLHCWRPTVSILHLYPLLILEIDFSVVAIFPSRARHRVRHRHRLPPAAPRFDRICRRSVSYRSGHPSARPRSKNELRNSTSISRSMRTRRANKALYVQPTLAFSPTAHCRASGWSIKKPPGIKWSNTTTSGPVCRPTPVGGHGISVGGFLAARVRSLLYLNGLLREATRACLVALSFALQTKRASLISANGFG